MGAVRTSPNDRAPSDDPDLRADSEQDEHQPARPVARVRLDRSELTGQTFVQWGRPARPDG